MILLTITNTRRKVVRILRIVVFLAILGLALPVFLGLLSKYTTPAGVKFKEEHPTGKPMQVEKAEPEDSQKNSRILDTFVIKLREFYQNNSD